MATYAIGDIQGCFDALSRLLDRCDFDASKDRLWLTGDLVNRGPRSLETLRFVRSLGDSAVTVLGNHDLYLLMIAEGFGRRSATDTLDDILNAPDRHELMAWLRRRPLCHIEGQYGLVHAGLLPQWTMARAKALASEVESALTGENWREFLEHHIWGDTPDRWQETLTGWPRLRAVVNAMTRMRFCTPAGVMNLDEKGSMNQTPPGFFPWFAVPGRLSAETTLVVGHWSALGLKLEPNLLAIDTGCLWGKTLTAVRLEDRVIFQVEASKDEICPLVV